MKKFLKTLGLLVIGYTIGEYITFWRTQTTPTSLKKFTKNYLFGQKTDFLIAMKGGALLADGDIDQGAQILKNLTFPNLPTE